MCFGKIKYEGITPKLVEIRPLGHQECLELQNCMSRLTNFICCSFDSQLHLCRIALVLKHCCNQKLVADAMLSRVNIPSLIEWLLIVSNYLRVDVLHLYVLLTIIIVAIQVA